MELKNTFVLRTDDHNFRQALDKFLFNHCKEKHVNAAVFETTEVGAEKVMKVVFEE